MSTFCKYFKCFFKKVSLLLLLLLVLVLVVVVVVVLVGHIIIKYYNRHTLKLINSVTAHIVRFHIQLLLVLASVARLV